MFGRKKNCKKKEKKKRKKEGKKERKKRKKERKERRKVNFVCETFLIKIKYQSGQFLHDETPKKRRIASRMTRGEEKVEKEEESG